MPVAKLRGKPAVLAKWVGALQCEESDEVLLLNSGMTRTVISRWDAATISKGIVPWSETVSQLCQQDADSRGGVCSYDLEHRRGNDAQATFLVRRIAATGSTTEAAGSIEGIVGMLMKHLEARDKQNAQMLDTVNAMVNANMKVLISRIGILESERRDILVREREAMEATVVAGADIESKERLESKMYQLTDLVMMKLGSGGDDKKTAGDTIASLKADIDEKKAAAKKNGAAQNKSGTTPVT